MMMIQILLRTGVWATVYEDANASTTDLSETAERAGLVAGNDSNSILQNGTEVNCAEVIAIRYNP